MIGFTLDAIDWLAGRRTEFTVLDFAEAIGVGRRSGYRWLYALEARDLVERSGQRECIGRGLPITTWRSTQRVRQIAEGAA